MPRYVSDKEFAEKLQGALGEHWMRANDLFMAYVALDGWASQSGEDLLEIFTAASEQGRVAEVIEVLSDRYDIPIGCGAPHPGSFREAQGLLATAIARIQNRSYCRRLLNLPVAA